jgi:voltage-gated potassium channel
MLADMTRVMIDAMTIEQWNRRTGWPLAAVTVGFLIAYAVPVLKPDIGPEALQACEPIAWASWVAFAIDNFVRVRLARSLADVRRQVLDLAVIVLPLLRPLRLLRLVAMLAVLNRGATAGLRGRVAVYVVGASLMTAFVDGIAGSRDGQ